MGRPVPVIRYGFYVIVHVGVEMLPALPVVDATGDDVPQMGNHTGTDKKLSFGIVINAPWIAFR